MSSGGYHFQRNSQRVCAGSVCKITQIVFINNTSPDWWIIIIVFLNSFPTSVNVIGTSYWCHVISVSGSQKISTVAWISPSKGQKPWWVKKLLLQSESKREKMVLPSTRIRFCQGTRVLSRTKKNTTHFKQWNYSNYCILVIDSGSTASR